MTPVINSRSQFEEGVVALTKEVESLKKQVADHEVEKRLLRRLGRL